MNDQITKFKGLIEKVDALKTGISPKTGRPWTLLRVTAGGINFTTFDTKYQALAGKEVEFEYKEETRGEFTNLVIITRKPQDAANQQINEKLDEINKKLDALLLADINPKSPTEFSKFDEEIPDVLPEDIPE